MHNRYFLLLKTDAQIMPLIQLLLLLFLLTGISANAQFSAGSSFFVKEGSVLSVDGLNLKPALDLDFSNQSVQKSSTPATTADPGSLGSIAAVYNLSHTLSYKGELGIRYVDGALNGNTPNLLALAYHDGTSGFSVVNILTLSNDDHLVWGSTGINTINLAKLTAVNSGVLLPVKLLYFRGKVLPGSVLLTWSTANELGNDHFEIERSADGNKFISLMKEPSKGNATFTQDYSKSDAHPVSGRNYYRLKQVSQDGTFSYSEVVSLSYNQKDGIKINIYPNPAHQYLNVEAHWSAPQVTRITIFDTGGRQVKHTTTGNLMNVSMRINVSSLSAGVYYLKVEGAEGSHSSSFSIVK
ncbi:MAG TPA: T9SS type A sorting domain-containing protein [Arachidicoccus sp.]|nr:T9SS type A sorting domain-containing protein [Arachidicoccus sp.]